MPWRIAPVLIFPLFIVGCFRVHDSARNVVNDLKLVAAYPVDIPRSLEPSGLVFIKGSLFTIADKVDSTIYRVETGSGVARMVPHLKFIIPKPYQDLDWEGITADELGNFYLISETYGRIMKVSRDAKGEWVTPDLRTKAREIGLFTKHNAGFEGVTLLSENHWLGAVEREPRGFVEVDQSMQISTIFPSRQMDSPFMDALPLLRIPDYSGLDTDAGEVFALFRNAHLVVRLKKEDGLWSESEAWSYRHIETDPRWAFIAQTFGQAEGLAIQGQDVFIIVDNNRGGRQSDPEDTRPLLIHARFPDSP